MGAAENNLEMEGTLEIGMGNYSLLTFLPDLLYQHSHLEIPIFAEYRTVSGVAGPLVILEKVKVHSCLLTIPTLVS